MWKWADTGPSTAQAAGWRCWHPAGASHIATSRGSSHNLGKLRHRRGRGAARAAEAASGRRSQHPEPQRSSGKAGSERLCAPPPPSPASPSITSPFAGEQMSVLAKKRSDRGRRSAFHMTCPGTEDVFVNPASCQFSLFTKGINHLLLLSPLTPDPPARPPLCRLEEAGKQFRLWLPSPPTAEARGGPPLTPPAWGAAAGDPHHHHHCHHHHHQPPRLHRPAASARPPPRLAAAARGWGLLPQRAEKGGGGDIGGRTTALPPFLPPGAAGAAGWKPGVRGVSGAAPRGPPAKTP